MHKQWTVMVDGRPHSVDASWDTVMTGGGHIAVDGVELDRWRLGIKWPGVTKPFTIGARRAWLRQRLFNFELFVEGVSQPGVKPGPPPGGDGRLVIVIAVLAALVIVLAAGGLVLWQVAR